jgi:glucose/arabinose dehydrogenase
MKKNIFTLLSVCVVGGFFSCSGQTKHDKDAAAVTAMTDTSRQSANSPNLPEPYATKSVHNFSKVLGWSNGNTPKAPEGFKVAKFGGDFKSPRWIYVMPNGDVLVAETKMEPKGMKKIGEALVGVNKSASESENMNRITILRDKNKDGSPEMQDVFLDSLNMPFGMVVIGNSFYVACTDALWRFPYKDGETKITAKGEKILDLPAEGRHWTKNIITNRQKNKIYIGIGSGSNVAEDGLEKEVRRARIIEVDLDGKNEKVYASGLRNPVGMDWQPGTDVLWTSVNERDELGDDLVPDYMTSVKEGGFYGWPFSYYGNHVDPRIKEKDQRPDLVSKAIVPDVELGPHTASLGFMFYNKNTFPAKYKNGAFVGQHGSWNRTVPTGYKVMFVPFTNNKAGKPEDFLTGFMENSEKNEVYGRPVGVVEMNDGSLLVADDAGNNVWRVSYGK